MSFLERPSPDQNLATLPKPAGVHAFVFDHEGLSISQVSFPRTVVIHLFQDKGDLAQRQELLVETAQKFGTVVEQEGHQGVLFRFEPDRVGLVVFVQPTAT